ncbi:RHS repeat-associated core domain-containing protein [Pseudomonas sp. PGPR40]|uniref:RHS repeat-associated core domain-containing protein n=1 Tax=Pseudomonas sp. PGPR40 TaxID=2913476 RepID=UPI001EDB031A|nr:RHS repeat-associated core domain-containing protein [Pseudomonas sp. PGPR40]
MSPNRETLLCRYYYDPLDRLVDSMPSAQASVQRFYLKDRLATEIQGVVQRSIMQNEDQLLAQQQRQSGAVETRLLVTDQQRSVLNVLDRASSHPIAYSLYGHRPAENGLLSLLGFNGERPDPVTGYYLLGNGYRAFNPVLMRFNSPDSWSPFGKGGLNAYGYCSGDPINRDDPTGHSWKVILANLKKISKMAKSPAQNAAHQPLKVLKINNLKNIANGVASFEDTYKGGRRINFISHANKPTSYGSSLIVDNTEWGPMKLFMSAQKKGINFESFDDARVISCYSGNGHTDSFAASFARLIKKPTKGYMGKVHTTQDVLDLSKGLSTTPNSAKHTSKQSLNDMYPSKDFFIDKVNPYNHKTEKDSYYDFTFRSVRYLP